MARGDTSHPNSGDETQIERAASKDARSAVRKRRNNQARRPQRRAVGPGAGGRGRPAESDRPTLAVVSPLTAEASERARERENEARYVYRSRAAAAAQHQGPAPKVTAAAKQAYLLLTASELRVTSLSAFSCVTRQLQ